MSSLIPEPISDEENVLTDIGQNSAGALTATWTPLPSIPSGLESHYHYVIQIQRMTSSNWTDWQDVLTVNHVADRDIYSETTDVTLELDVRYRVRLQAVREHQNLRERTIVSQVLQVVPVARNTQGKRYFLRNCTYHMYTIPLFYSTKQHKKAYSNIIQFIS